MLRWRPDRHRETLTANLVEVEGRCDGEFRQSISCDLMRTLPDTESRRMSRRPSVGSLVELFSQDEEHPAERLCRAPKQLVAYREGTKVAGP